MIKWLKNLHEAIYKEEQPVAIIFDPITPGQKAMQAMHQANNLYHQALGQNAQIYTTTGTGSLSGGFGPGTLMPGIGNNNVNTIATTWIPSRIGSHLTMLFVDAAGIHHHLVVDQAYMGILQQMSGVPFPNSITTAQVPTPAQHKMLEGDFSLDEMEEAEKLIAELAGDKTTKGHKASQDTEYASEGI